MINLQPSIVWEYFHQITQIPRPSKQEEKITNYLEEFAATHHLSCKKDDAGNLLICKASSTGYENHPTVILQAHMDMVCEKNSHVTHNFDTDPIQTYIEDDWVRAKGTTLGADNGIGMAMMLALLSDNQLQHPPLECLFTVDEETGLTGAFALSNDLLSGSKLINLDSEDDAEIFIGCAGGIGTKALFPYKNAAIPAGFVGFKVCLSGLSGGHSGSDIHLGLGNAIKLLNQFLWQVNKKMDLRLALFEGGNLHNAIPREASAMIAIPNHAKETLRVMLNMYVAEIEEEFNRIEPNFNMTLDSEPAPGAILNKADSNRLLNVLYACPHGVISMSKDIPDLVETSTNLASVKFLSDNIIEINTSQRSSVEKAKNDLAAQLFAVFDLAGAETIQSDGYPGWKPNLQSALLHTTATAYQSLFGKEAAVKAIHAGLECGLFLEKYPQLDMVSIGPQMYGVHSPDERLSISSTQKTWKWLVEILKNC